MKTVVFALFAALGIALVGLTGVAYAQEAAGGSTDGSKLLGAGIAFGVAAGGAGVGLGYVGSAGLAVISENPALQSKVFIFIGMVKICGVCNKLALLRMRMHVCGSFWHSKTFKKAINH